MEYLSADNAKDTLTSMQTAFDNIFKAIGTARIDRDMRDLSSFEKFQIKGSSFQDFAKIANRVRCRFAPLLLLPYKAGDWIYEKDFFSIKFSIEEIYYLHKTRFDKIGEKGTEIKIRKYIEVKGSRRKYGLKDWDSKKILELISGNKDEKLCEIVKSKLKEANVEVKKMKEVKK